MKFLNFSLLLLLMWSCNTSQNNKTKDNAETGSQANKDWVENSIIYEVNLRQFSQEGTIKAFEKRLPELKKLGVNILWFMPIHPIGVKERKGSLGSYYSVKNYKELNPEFGSIDDFKAMVKKCHEMGFKVIIDWVANHTSWDNPWVSEHPDWYTKDSSGKMIPPVPDWSDVVDLNFENTEMQDAMIDAMSYWVSNCDIDGFRCDVAMMVPTAFWEKATTALNEIKPMFMLAEAEQADHMKKAFDMCYAWEYHHLAKQVYKGEKTVTALSSYIDSVKIKYPENTIKMNFVQNHDENTWNGTANELFGPSIEMNTVLSFMIPGMPMIYNGMEAGLNKRLKFFDKDPIDWNAKDAKQYFDFYKNLCDIRHQNKALWVNRKGNTFEQIFKNNKQVYAFKLKSSSNEVMVVCNLTNKIAPINRFEINGWEQFFVKASKGVDTDGEKKFNLAPYGYVVLTLN